MKKPKIKVVPLVAFLAASMLFTSCLTTKTKVGGYQEQQGNEYKYSKSKQVWVFWGLLPLGRTNTATPANGKCEVITRINLVDLFISGLTGGIVSTQTIKVMAKDEANQEPK